MSNNNTTSSHSTSEIYDRQIRLWGADAQSKISSARILYIHITGVSAEILKNLVLAGVSASIYDPRQYPDSIKDTPTCFFPQPYDDTVTNISVAKAIEPYIMELNPLLRDSLEICSNDKDIEDILSEEYIQKFDVIIASQLDMKQCMRISQISSKYKNYFCLVDTFGYNGCCIIDFGSKDREYRREIGKDKLSDVMTIGEKYVSLEDIWNRNIKNALGRWDKVVPPKIWFEYRLILQYVYHTGCWPTYDEDSNEECKLFLQNCKSFLSSQHFDYNLLDKYYGPTEQDINDGLSTLGSIATAQLSPVCSALGGIVGNEVIKILSGKGEPANNVLLLDGLEGSCRQFFIQ